MGKRFFNDISSGSIKWPPHRMLHPYQYVKVSRVSTIWTIVTWLLWFGLSLFCQSQNATREKLYEALLYEKGACKMLIKLTQGNIRATH